MDHYISSTASIEMGDTNIRTFPLNDGEHQQGELFRLQKGWYLDFRLGPSLFGHRVMVYTNLPEGGATFVRNRYRLLPWTNSSSSDDAARAARVKLELTGTFHYYFLCDDSESPHGSGYLLVDPVLTVSGDTLPLDCIQCVTYLSKCLGPFSSWRSKLQVAKETGYNMVHFTPIQELGESNSAYSLRNQLELNPTFSEEGCKVQITQVAELTDMMRNEWKMLSMCDIVLNHTANESAWLALHPECTYNLVNSPHLKPAYLLDVVLHQLTVEVAQGLWELSGIPRQVSTDHHLSSIRHALLGTLLPRARIAELYQLDVAALVAEFQRLARNKVPPLPVAHAELPSTLQLLLDPQYQRLHATVDMDLALRIYNVYRADCFDEDTRIRRCTDDFKHCIESLNDAVNHKVHEDLLAAVQNCIAGIRYFRVQPDGPRLTEVSEKTPLIPRYFTDYKGIPNEEVMYTAEACYVMAHNGWVIDGDPLVNFAGPESGVYLRRELIAWGDSVKLRYGDGPDDCPFLWQHMQTYVEETARVFDGIRLDNCHSTPLAVAEYLLDAARRVRPNLYVAAELFTNSDQKDNIFVNRLGITSLIREAMSAWDSHEEGRLVYRYGGRPVGAFLQPPERPLTPSIAHALFLDQTHDNPSPVTKRSVFDLLPSTALVAMACCATGSSIGYDQLVPHHIHVVDEGREYMGWRDGEAGLKQGIAAGKKALNNLHYSLGIGRYDQVFVDQVDGDIVCVTRHCERTRESVVLLAYTAFHHPAGEAGNAVGKGITVSGNVHSVILEASLAHKGDKPYAEHSEYKRNPHKINGLNEYSLSLRENLRPGETAMLEMTPTNEGGTRLNLSVQFKPGCVVAVRVTPDVSVKPALQKLSSPSDMSHILSGLSLADLNVALYRCVSEEGSSYDVPGYGPLIYCGLQGIMSVLGEIATSNDLGHPLCTNLRAGPWLSQYTVKRLQRHPGTHQLGEWLHGILTPLADLPRFLVPAYFHLVVSRAHAALINHAHSLMSEFVRDGSVLCKALALGSVQCGGVVDTSPLPPLSDAIAPPAPPTMTQDGHTKQACVTIAAGLPHFASGYMRNWGRDTFIALRGLFIITGRYDETRYHLLGYAGALRHGLIPNLLNAGVNARYNCRDAVWWWLYSLKCYVQEAPNGAAILNDKVNRLFPTDDSPATSVEQPMHQVVQEAMNAHFQGLIFRERNAGSGIDAHMTNKGFHNQIGIHPSTGFVFGGSEWNCGTWMDKMGSSEKAGTKGRPATPRDGSAIELVGLCKAVVHWLAAAHEQGIYPHSGVTRQNKDGTETTWTYVDWDTRIASNFEKEFWVSPTQDPSEKRPDLVHRRGIYKDTVGASQPWTDYQLRCNFPIAMVVAPELFTPSHAWTAIQTAEQLLLGPLGMRTLDPEDWAYNGFYDNDNDSDDAKVAKGFNYHQGPEWLWPVGFLLRAKLLFAKRTGGHDTLRKAITQTRKHLAHHFVHLHSTPWRGLPELTNKDGAHCSGSCTVQAWSMSTIMETLEDISKAEAELNQDSAN